jgi:hypothetical protein
MTSGHSFLSSALLHCLSSQSFLPWLLSRTFPLSSCLYCQCHHWVAAVATLPLLLHCCHFHSSVLSSLHVTSSACSTNSEDQKQLRKDMGGKPFIWPFIWPNAASEAGQEGVFWVTLKVSGTVCFYSQKGSITQCLHQS